jgi:hypothetical protein
MEPARRATARSSPRADLIALVNMIVTQAMREVEQAATSDERLKEVA